MIIETDGDHFFVRYTDKEVMMVDDLKAHAIMKHVGIKNAPEVRMGRIDPGVLRDHPEIRGLIKQAYEFVNKAIADTGDEVRLGSNLNDWEVSFKATGMVFAGRCSGGAGEKRYERFKATLKKDKGESAGFAFPKWDSYSEY